MQRQDDPVRRHGPKRPVRPSLLDKALHQKDGMNGVSQGQNKPWARDLLHHSKHSGQRPLITLLYVSKDRISAGTPLFKMTIGAND